MEKKRFFDIQIRLVIEHYEKLSHNFMTKEDYARGYNFRELKANEMGPKLIIQVFS